MFRLTYDRLSSRDGWIRYEELYTPGEARTAVEIAREKAARPNKYRNVCLLDLRFVKTPVPVFVQAEDEEQYHYPVLVLTKTIKSPDLKVVDLGKLPRKKTATKAKKTPALAVANAEQLPKPRRTSKRERTFGTAELVTVN